MIQDEKAVNFSILGRVLFLLSLNFLFSSLRSTIFIFLRFFGGIFPFPEFIYNLLAGFGNFISIFELIAYLSLIIALFSIKKQLNVRMHESFLKFTKGYIFLVLDIIISFIGIEISNNYIEEYSLDIFSSEFLLFMLLLMLVSGILRIIFYLFCLQGWDNLDQSHNYDIINSGRSGENGVNTSEALKGNKGNKANRVSNTSTNSAISDLIMRIKWVIKVFCIVYIISILISFTSWIISLNAFHIFILFILNDISSIISYATTISLIFGFFQLSIIFIKLSRNLTDFGKQGAITSEKGGRYFIQGSELTCVQCGSVIGVGEQYCGKCGGSR